jgi:hypothetical protein
MVANVISRNSPKTLDKSVIPPTVKVDRISLVLRVFSNIGLLRDCTCCPPISKPLFPFKYIANALNLFDKLLQKRHPTSSFFQDGLKQWQIQLQQKNAPDRQKFIAHVM